MREWLMQKLASKMSNEVILLGWQGEPGGGGTFHTVHIDVMLRALFATFNESTGQYEGLSIPATGSYTKLIAADADGTKGYKQIFEQWHAEGIL